MRVRHEMGGTERLRASQHDLQNSTRGTVFFWNLALGGGVEPGEKNTFISPQLPADSLHFFFPHLKKKKMRLLFFSQSNGIHLIKIAL